MIPEFLHLIKVTHWFYLQPPFTKIGVNIAMKREEKVTKIIMLLRQYVSIISVLKLINIINVAVSIIPI